MPKQPDWKSRTALNITEFTLFDIFGSACRGVEILSKFAESLNNYGVAALLVRLLLEEIFSLEMCTRFVFFQALDTKKQLNQKQVSVLASPS